MKAQLLEKPPISGTYPERWYDAVGECSWVLFEDENYEDWVGVFGQGDMVRFSAALLFDTTAVAFIVSHGRCYIVDINSGELRYRTKGEDLVDIIAVPGRDLIIATDAYTRLCAFTSVGKVWHSGSVAADGIRYKEATTDRVRGQVWQYDGWYSFTLHFKGWRFVQGQCVSKDWKGT